MKKIITVIVCFCLSFVGAFHMSGIKYVSAQENILTRAAFEKDNESEQKVSDSSLQLQAKSAVLMDGDSGRILYQKESEKKMPMASTTKIMTCIVALEHSSPDQIVNVSQRAAKMPKVHMNIIKGEQYYMKDLLRAMMLESYNDVAVAVAEQVGGSVEKFAEMMNQKAREIGAVNTNFVTPNGLDADNHYSTAYDMALIGAYAVKKKDFLEITNTKSHNFTDLTGKRHFAVYNKDAFLTMDSEAIGIKTGFTGKAGYCFVGAVKSNGRLFVSCVLACGWPPNKTYKWKDTRTLMSYGKENYQFRQVMEKNRTLEIRITQGTKPKIKAQVEGESNLLLSQKDDIDIATEFQYQLPIRKNNIIGNVTIYVNHEKIESHNIIAMENVEKYDYSYCIKRVINYFFFQ